jgi:hypothetical protein
MGKIIGYIGCTPLLKTSIKNNKEYLFFTIATKRIYKNQELTDWRCVNLYDDALLKWNAKLQKGDKVEVSACEIIDRCGKSIITTTKSTSINLLTRKNENKIPLPNSYSDYLNYKG